MASARSLGDGWQSPATEPGRHSGRQLAADRHHALEWQASDAEFGESVVKPRRAADLRPTELSARKLSVEAEAGQIASVLSAVCQDAACENSGGRIKRQAEPWPARRCTLIVCAEPVALPANAASRIHASYPPFNGRASR